MSTQVMPCTCQHQYQDSRYGIRQRLHNRIVKDGKHRGWRCTVCAEKKMG